MATKTPAQKPLAEWAKEQARLINTSELHRRTGLDRATVRSRLDAAGVAPRKTLKKETFYDEREALAVLTGTSQADAVGLKKVHAQKISVQTARELLKLQQERGELVPISDLREHAYDFIKAMHTRFTRYGKDARRTLKLSSEQAQQFESDVALIFDDLKRDYPKIF